MRYAFLVVAMFLGAGFYSYSMRNVQPNDPNAINGIPITATGQASGNVAWSPNNGTANNTTLGGNNAPSNDSASNPSGNPSATLNGANAANTSQYGLPVAATTGPNATSTPNVPPTIGNGVTPTPGQGIPPTIGNGVTPTPGQGIPPTIGNGVTPTNAQGQQAVPNGASPAAPSPADNLGNNQIGSSPGNQVGNPGGPSNGNNGNANGNGTNQTPPATPNGNANQVGTGGPAANPGPHSAENVLNSTAANAAAYTHPTGALPPRVGTVGPANGIGLGGSTGGANVGQAGNLNGNNGSITGPPNNPSPGERQPIGVGQAAPMPQGENNQSSGGGPAGYAGGGQQGSPGGSQEGQGGSQGGQGGSQGGQGSSQGGSQTSGGFGGYGGGYSGGGYATGYPGSWYTSAYLNGMANVVRSAGYANVMNSEAYMNNEQAFSTDLDNRLKALNNYFEVKKMNASLRDKERGTQSTSLQREHYAREMAPKPLSRSEYDAATGSVAWTPVLLDDRYTKFRESIERLLVERQSDTSSAAEYRKIIDAMEELRGAMREHIDTYSPTAYVDAGKFLDSLEQEVRSGSQ